MPFLDAITLHFPLPKWIEHRMRLHLFLTQFRIC